MNHSTIVDSSSLNTSSISSPSPRGIRRSLLRMSMMTSSQNDNNNNNTMNVEPADCCERIRSLRSAAALPLRVRDTSAPDSGKVPHTIITTTTTTTRKSLSDCTPQKPMRENSDQKQRKTLAPKRRSKPRRQSGMLCRGRNDRPDTVRNMMVLMRTDSDRRILVNTLERKLRRVAAVAEQ
ncbi:expressed unknown protein [Seminavis robusta]|uniref:Uncharacterized protein n=1 Tax=Seminavis robusta TaxID=568900 RepID=A0A9N8D8T1_9STRA|nr:expressed unknown protein [Seminavis robusta]|eukprot:Sro40_g024570.1 n/a (180) ;mRNA; f:39281-39820